MQRKYDWGNVLLDRESAGEGEGATYYGKHD
jgi:hypothetical protein